MIHRIGLIILFLAVVALATAAERFGAGYQKFTGPECAWCGGRATSVSPLQAHHIQTEAHIRARLEAGEITQEEAEDLANNDPKNIVTLCRRCHFVLGHRCNWHRENTNILAMITAGKGDMRVAPTEGERQ